MFVATKRTASFANKDGGIPKRPRQHSPKKVNNSHICEVDMSMSNNALGQLTKHYASDNSDHELQCKDAEDVSLWLVFHLCFRIYQYIQGSTCAWECPMFTLWCWNQHSCVHLVTTKYIKMSPYISMQSSKVMTWPKDIPCCHEFQIALYAHMQRFEYVLLYYARVHRAPQHGHTKYDRDNMSVQPCVTCIDLTETKASVVQSCIFLIGKTASDVEPKAWLVTRATCKLVSSHTFVNDSSYGRCHLGMCPSTDCK